MTAVDEANLAFDDMDDAGIDGAGLLDEIVATVRKYCILPSDAAYDAVALYVAVTHAIEGLEFAPRLHISSPEKRSGKSRLLEVLECLVCNPKVTINMSVALLGRVLSTKPTLLMDEIDAIFSRGAGKDESTDALRGMLNGGFRLGATYDRYDAATGDMQSFSVFACVILAGIGGLPDTIADRAIPIKLRRKLPHERVSRFRLRTDKPVVQDLGQRVSEWVRPNAELIGEDQPDMPEEIQDRAQDCWEPLVAVADLAGVDWPHRARVAAIELTNDDASEEDPARRILRDVRDVIGDDERMSNADLLAGLKAIDDAPWAEWFLTSNRLSRMLAPYGIANRVYKSGQSSVRGYFKSDMADAFARYLTPDDSDIPF